MKKCLLQHRPLRAIRIAKMKYKKTIRKTKRVFFSSQKQSLGGATRLAHFQLQEYMLCETSLEALTNHIELYRLIGFQVKVTTLQQRTPSEVLGYLSCWNGAKLEYREELRIQTVVTEKKTIGLVRIFQSADLTDQISGNNNSCNSHFNNNIDMNAVEKFNAGMSAQVVNRREGARARLQASMKSSCEDCKPQVDNRDKRRAGDV